MKTILSLGLVVVLFCGCEETPTTDNLAVTPKVPEGTNMVEKVERFTVKSYGTFNAGYDNAAREIFILKDTVTGQEYLGVTDCTVQLIKKKNDERNEAVIDAIGEVTEAFADAASE